MDYKFLFKPLFFIVSLLVGTLLILYIEKLKPSDLGSYASIFDRKSIITKRSYYPLRGAKTLTVQEYEYARIAWKYFENNFNASTGFVNSHDQYPATNFRDMTSYLMGMISAYEIGIIDSTTLDKRLQLFFNSLQSLKLYDRKLPNKMYHVSTLQMLNANHKPSFTGMGWSAIDIGRFYSFVNKIRFDYPQYLPHLKQGINRWKLDNMIIDGYLFGITEKGIEKKLQKVQEGTLGYEEYCSKGLFMAGHDVSEALLHTDFIKFVTIYDHEIAVDVREVDNQLTYNYTISDPYILEGLEYGWDINSKELANAQPIKTLLISHSSYNSKLPK